MLGLKPSDFIEGGLLSDYRFLNYKKEKDRKAVKHMTVISSKDLTKEIKCAEVTASSVFFARDLINTPSNDMTPTALEKAARLIKGVSVKVLERKEAGGGEAIALMGNGEGLMEKLRHAGEETGERLWRMPLFEEYKEYIKSDIADIKNSKGATGIGVRVLLEFLRE